MSNSALLNLESQIGFPPGTESRKGVPDHEISILDHQRQNVISWLTIKGVESKNLSKSSLITLGKMYRISAYLNSVLLAQERDNKSKTGKKFAPTFSSDLGDDDFNPDLIPPKFSNTDIDIKSSPTQTSTPTFNPNQFKPVIEVIARQIVKDENTHTFTYLNQELSKLATELGTTVVKEIQTKNENLNNELKKLVEEIIFQSYLNQKIKNTETETETETPPAPGTNNQNLIPKIDPNYHFDTYAIKVIRSALSMGENLYVYGDTGCGKTTHLEQVCAVLNRGLIRINPHDGITREMFLGGMKLINNETIFIEGALPKAMREGLVFLVDEISFLPPNLTAILNPIGEKNGKLYIPETNEWISPQPGFCIFATDNTGGKGDRTGNYTGTEVQNTATLDRFAFCLKMNYLPPEKEKEMLEKRFPNRNLGELIKMLSLAKDIRLAFSRGELAITLSTRKLIKFFDQRNNNFTIEEALSNTILSWLDEDDETLVKTMIDRLDLLKGVSS